MHLPQLISVLFSHIPSDRSALEQLAQGKDVVCEYILENCRFLRKCIKPRSVYYVFLASHAFGVKCIFVCLCALRMHVSPLRSRPCSDTAAAFGISSSLFIEKATLSVPREKSKANRHKNNKKLNTLCTLINLKQHTFPHSNFVNLSLILTLYEEIFNPRFKSLKIAFL